MEQEDWPMCIHMASIWEEEAYLKRHNSCRHELVGRNMTTELEIFLPTGLTDALVMMMIITLRDISQLQFSDKFYHLVAYPSVHAIMNSAAWDPTLTVQNIYRKRTN